MKYKLIKNLGLYTVLNLVNSLVPFLLLPVLTKYLTTEQYGAIDIFNNISFILGPIVGLNVASSILRYYYEDEKFNRKIFISSVVNFILLFGISLFVLFSIFKFIFQNIYDDNGNQILKLFSYAVLYSLFSQINEVLLSYYRASEAPLKFGLFRISKTILDLGVSVFVIIYIYAGWEARVYTALIVAVLFAVLSTYFIAKEVGFSFKIKKAYINEAISYSSPLIIHSVSGYILAFSDRFIILHFHSLEMVGLYSVAYQLGMVMSFISNSFNQAWTPFLFSKLKIVNLSILKSLNKLNVLYCIGLAITAFIIYLFIPFIYKNFIGKEFLVDSRLVLIVLISYVFNGMYKILVNYMFYYKNTMRLSIYTLISALMNILLCWFLVPIIGIFGAAYATLCSFIVLFILVLFDYIKLNRNLKYKFKKDHV